MSLVVAVRIAYLFMGHISHKRLSEWQRDNSQKEILI